MSTGVAASRAPFSSDLLGLLRSALAPTKEVPLAPEARAHVDAVSAAAAKLRDAALGDDDVLRGGVADLNVEAFADALDAALFSSLRAPARSRGAAAPHFRDALLAAAALDAAGDATIALERATALAYVHSDHGVCRAWHRAALASAGLRGALRQLWRADAAAWHAESVCGSRTGRDAIDAALAPLDDLQRRGVRILARCDDARLDVPFSAFDARLRPVARGAPPRQFDLTLAGSEEVVGSYSLREAAADGGAQAYDNAAGYEIVRLRIHGVSRDAHAWYVRSRRTGAAYYACVSDADSPPLFGWRTCFNVGEIPAPVLAEAAPRAAADVKDAPQSGGAPSHFEEARRGPGVADDATGRKRATSMRAANLQAPWDAPSTGDRRPSYGAPLATSDAAHDCRASTHDAAASAAPGEAAAPRRRASLALVLSATVSGGAASPVSPASDAPFPSQDASPRRSAWLTMTAATPSDGRAAVSPTVPSCGSVDDEGPRGSVDDKGPAAHLTDATRASGEDVIFDRRTWQVPVARGGRAAVGDDGARGRASSEGRDDDCFVDLLAAKFAEAKVAARRDVLLATAERALRAAEGRDETVARAMALVAYHGEAAPVDPTRQSPVEGDFLRRGDDSDDALAAVGDDAKGATDSEEEDAAGSEDATGQKGPRWPLLTLEAALDRAALDRAEPAAAAAAEPAAAAAAEPAVAAADELAAAAADEVGAAKEDEPAAAKEDEGGASVSDKDESSGGLEAARLWRGAFSAVAERSLRRLCEFGADVSLVEAEAIGVEVVEAGSQLRVTYVVCLSFERRVTLPANGAADARGSNYSAVLACSELRRPRRCAVAKLALDDFARLRVAVDACAAARAMAFVELQLIGVVEARLKRRAEDGMPLGRDAALQTAAAPALQRINAYLGRVQAACANSCAAEAVEAFVTAAALEGKAQFVDVGVWQPLRAAADTRAEPPMPEVVDAPDAWDVPSTDSARGGGACDAARAVSRRTPLSLRRDDDVLARQRHACPSCGERVAAGLFARDYAPCRLQGTLVCKRRCHGDAHRVLPWRAVLGDFVPHRCARAAAKLLDDRREIPFVRLPAGALLYAALPHLSAARKLRGEISDLREDALRGRRGAARATEVMLALLSPDRLHFALAEAYFWSLGDLEAANEGRLVGLLASIAAAADAAFALADEAARRGDESEDEGGPCPPRAFDS